MQVMMHCEEWCYF